MRTIVLILFCLTYFSFLHAQNITQLAWDFNSRNGNELSVDASINNVNIESSVVLRGPGLTAATLANAFNSTAWTVTNSLADAIANNDYLQFTVKAKSSYNLSLASLESNFRRSSTGPDHFQWMYSLNGNAFSLLGNEIVYTGTATNGNNQSAVDLSSIPTLQNLNASITVTIRLYGYNAVSASGSFALGRLAGNDLSVTGSTQAIAPVVLKYLNSVADGKIITLRWASLSEAHHQYYDVQRSKDGQQFTTIGRLNSSNSFNGHVYQFKDMQPEQGNNFYRLKMIDINDDFEYSFVTAVKMFKPVVEPQIICNGYELLILQNNGHALVMICAMNGQVIKRVEGRNQSGYERVNIEFLPPGNYVLLISSKVGNYSRVIERR